MGRRLIYWANSSSWLNDMCTTSEKRSPAGKFLALWIITSPNFELYPGIDPRRLELSPQMTN